MHILNFCQRQNTRKLIMQKLLILFLLGLCCVSHTLGVVIDAVECSARLKTPRSDVEAVYDGQDIIYIFGGLFYDPADNLIPYSDVHAYNISSDNISVIAQLPRTAWGGRAFYEDETGDILYLRADGTFLWRYSPSTGETVSVGPWLGSSASPTLTLTPDKQLLAFGGLEDPTAIYKFDINNAGVDQRKIGVLPLQSELSVGIYSPEEQLTYIFAGQLGTRNPKLMIYNHTSYSTTLRTTPTFPSWRHGDGDPIWIKGHVYLVGVAVENGIRGNGIIRFNKDSTGEVEFIGVENLPNELSWTAGVYVERLNRIYFIGGYNLNNIDLDQIWYVSLDNLDI